MTRKAAMCVATSPLACCCGMGTSSTRAGVRHGPVPFLQGYLHPRCLLTWLQKAERLALHLGSASQCTLSWCLLLPYLLANTKLKYRCPTRTVSREGCSTAVSLQSDTEYIFMPSESLWKWFLIKTSELISLSFISSQSNKGSVELPLNETKYLFQKQRGTWKNSCALRAAFAAVSASWWWLIGNCCVYSSEGRKTEQRSVY